MRIMIVLLVLSQIGLFTSCKNKGEKANFTEQSTELVEVTKSESPSPVQSKPEPVVKQMNYYLVAGCFKVSSNAERLNAKLLNEGYDSKIQPFHNMSMVTYDGYTTRQQAQQALNRIVNESGKRATWVYPVR